MENEQNDRLGRFVFSLRLLICTFLVCIHTKLCTASFSSCIRQVNSRPPEFVNLDTCKVISFHMQNHNMRKVLLLAHIFVWLTQYTCRCLIQRWDKSAVSINTQGKIVDIATIIIIVCCMNSFLLCMMYYNDWPQIIPAIGRKVKHPSKAILHYSFEVDVFNLVC